MILSSNMLGLIGFYLFLPLRSCLMPEAKLRFWLPYHYSLEYRSCKIGISTRPLSLRASDLKHLTFPFMYQDQIAGK
jgi:hypothetical protein